MRVNLFADSAGGGGNTPEVHEQNPPDVSHAPPPAAPAPAPAAPPAAATVIAGSITEETERLRIENEELKKTVKQRETEHASVSDEFKRYKDATEARAVPVNPGNVPATAKRRFLRR
jgi:hypothetical protein